MPCSIPELYRKKQFKDYAMPMTVEEAIAKADSAIEELAQDYPKHLLKTLDEMTALAREENWAELAIAAHDLKGQAATVGWPIVGLMAKSMDAAFGIDCPSHYPKAAEFHIDSMRICLAQKLDTSSDHAWRLLDALEKLVLSMRKKAGEHAATDNA